MTTRYGVDRWPACWSRWRGWARRASGSDGGRRAPLSIGGQPDGLQPFRGELSVASAQLKSALVFAALCSTGESEIVEVGPSRDHTERMLRAMGAEIETEGATVRVRPGATLRPRDVHVPGDISAAAFWMVAAAIVPDSDLTLPAVGVNPTRAGIVDALRAMGADVALENERDVSGEPVADIRVRYAPLHGFEASGDLVVRALDEWPVIAVAAALAEGSTEIRDAEELRVKESDRIATTAEMLRALGAAVEERPDGLLIEGGATLRGGIVDSQGDHRIAMAAAVAAMVADGDTELRGSESVAISYPEFWRDLERFRDGVGGLASRRWWWCSPAHRGRARTPCCTARLSSTRRSRRSPPPRRARRVRASGTA